MKLLALPRRKRRRRKTRKLTTPMIPLPVKNLLLTLTAYLPPMLKLKTVLSSKRTRRRMILPRCEKKKHPTNAKSILDKTSSQEEMGRKENHGYRNPCPFQV